MKPIPLETARQVTRICIPTALLCAIAGTCSAATSTPPPVASGSFHALDYLALIGYLVVIVGIGVYFSRRENSTDDYFLAGRRIRWWAASLSIFSTHLSAVTFMAIPAKAFKTDWVTILVNLGIILVAPLTVFCFLPFYRRLNVTTIYEYLEQRFSPGMRVYGSLSFVLLQPAKMGVFLLLPALALSTVTGFNVYASIVIMGVLCTIYTVLGGIEAVIWTDVLQSCVLLGGGLLCIGTIFAAEQFDFGNMMAVAVDADKFHIFNMKGGIDSSVFWVVIIGGFFIQMVPFTSDQILAQRFLTTRDEKSAARSLWAHAAIVVPASLLFFGLGTALYVYYASRPELLPSGDVKNDANGRPERDGDYRKGFSTPLLIDVGGKEQLISPASTATLAYEPRTGREIWRVRNEGHTPAVSPVLGSGLVFAATGYRWVELLAIRPDGTRDVTGSHVA